MNAAIMRSEEPTTTKIVLAGGGGHALSVLEATADPRRIAGYTSPTPSDMMPAEWLGDDDATPQLAERGYRFHMAFVYHGLPLMDRRREIIGRYREMGARFESIIAPTAIVTRNSTLGEGCAILNGAIVNRATIGENTVVNSGAIVEHDCVVGSNTFIGPGVVIGGAVTIGDDCFIGLGTRIKNCVKIASGVSVAMGANVTTDLLEPGIYHGTPLRLHKPRRR